MEFDAWSTYELEDDSKRESCNAVTKTSSLRIDAKGITQSFKHADMVPAFCYGMGDAETGAKSSGEVTGEFFMGVPSKIHTIQLVKIQPGERLAATSELNPSTRVLVTGCCEAIGVGYCAATQVKVLSPEIFIVSEADVVHLTEGSTLITVSLNLRSWNIAESSEYTPCTHVEDVLLKSRMRENLTSGSVRAVIVTSEISLR